MSGGGSGGSDGNFGEKLLALLICTLFSVVGGAIFAIPNGFKFRGKRFKPWFTSIKIPPFLGMLLFGLMARNLPGDMLEHLDPDWSSSLRTVALTVILYRAGLELDLDSLKKMGRATGLLTVLPQIAEGVSAGILGWLLMDIPIMLSLAMGFMLGAVSPAVVVQGLVKLQSEGYGVEKGIPTLIMAAASLDDVLAITLFSIFISVSFAGSGEGSLLGDGIAAIIGTAFIDILGGILVGLIIGFGLKYLKDVKNPAVHFATTMTIAIAIVFATGLIGLHGAGFLAVITYGAMCGKFWQNEEDKEKDEIRIEDIDRLEKEPQKQLRPEAYLAFGKLAKEEEKREMAKKAAMAAGEEGEKKANLEVDGGTEFKMRDPAIMTATPRRVDFSVKVRSATRSVAKKLAQKNSAQTMKLKSKYSKAQISRALQQEIEAPIVFKQATMSFRALSHDEKYLYKFKKLAAKMREEEGKDNSLNNEILKGIKETVNADEEDEPLKKTGNGQEAAGDTTKKEDGVSAEKPSAEGEGAKQGSHDDHAMNPVHYCDEKAALVWGFMVYLLFGLIGAEVKLGDLEGDSVGYSFIIIVLAGVLIRTSAVMLSCWGTGLNFMEKFFVGLSFLPKATVQAAIGGQALDLAREDKESYIDHGLNILNISVLSIIITAPIGAILIATTGPKWLQQIETHKKPVDVFEGEEAETDEVASLKEVNPNIIEEHHDDSEEADN